MSKPPPISVPRGEGGLRLRPVRHPAPRNYL